MHPVYLEYPIKELAAAGLEEGIFKTTEYIFGFYLYEALGFKKRRFFRGVDL